jgi:cytochrome c oxidase assembly protein subunit 15
MLQISPAFITRARPRALARWLFVAATMILAVLVVGGITRLTNSGLSITRWTPISGVIPPLNHAQWMAEFARYQQIPEYQQINRGMTLSGFKAIFFWEYLHRLLARATGAVFAVPLIWFWARQQIPAGYKPRLLALLAMGGLQGALGWWMVSSGLSVRTDVSHIRLAMHLLTALVTLSGIVWTALDLLALHEDRLAASARITATGAIALSLLLTQITFGAFTAGLDAGYAFASWPLMGDRLFPAGVPMLEPTWRNLVDNPITVQFVHRWLAFAAAAGLFWLAVRATRAGSSAGYAVVALVCLQIALGIATLLSGVQIGIAVAHQANAALLLIATVAAVHAVGRERRA